MAELQHLEFEFIWDLCHTAPICITLSPNSEKEQFNYPGLHFVTALHTLELYIYLIRLCLFAPLRISSPKLLQTLFRLTPGGTLSSHGNRSGFICAYGDN